MSVTATSLYGKAKVAAVKQMADLLREDKSYREISAAIRAKTGVTVSHVGIWKWFNAPKPTPKRIESCDAALNPDFPDIETDEIELNDGMRESYAYAVRALLWSELTIGGADTVDKRAEAIGRGLQSARLVGELYSKMIEKMDDTTKIEAIADMKAVLEAINAQLA